MQIVRWIWAAPCVFLIHGAEEIATIAPWLRDKHADLPTAIQPFATVTTKQFALGVGLLFLILLAFTLHAVRRAPVVARFRFSSWSARSSRTALHTLVRQRPLADTRPASSPP
jgi:hypothetical protein